MINAHPILCLWLILDFLLVDEQVKQKSKTISLALSYDFFDLASLFDDSLAKSNPGPFPFNQL